MFLYWKTRFSISLNEFEIKKASLLKFSTESDVINIEFIRLNSHSYDICSNKIELFKWLMFSVRKSFGTQRSQKQNIFITSLSICNQIRTSVSSLRLWDMHYAICALFLFCCKRNNGVWRVVRGPGGVHWGHQVYFANARKCHRVKGSATKSAVAFPRHNPGNEVVLQLSDNGKRWVSGAFQITGYCG